MSTGPTANDAAPFAHQPSLDGIRALAVLAVMLFHGGIRRASAGFIGVDVFLVLSGFLITFLLLREIGAGGRVNVKAFWLRRARRLLPALVLLLIAVALFGAFVATDNEAVGLRGDLFGSLFYVQNWRLVFSGESYFAQFGSPSPLRHMWSLAIEEQWYLVWPLAFVAIVRLTRSRLRSIGMVILALAFASAVLMAILYQPGGDATRVYYGTDTRAQALLIGAALAVAFRARRSPRTPATAAVLQIAGLAGLGFLIWVTVTKSGSWQTLYRGGFSMIAIASAALIAGAMTRGPVRSLLSIPPLPLIGVISYGLYLWHWPLFVFLSPARTGIEGNALLALRFAATFAIATASYVLVERPIRQQRFRWVRNRALWVPVTVAVTAVAMLGLTATGAAARPRAHVITAEEIMRELNRPPRPGAVRVLVTGDSIAYTLAFINLPSRLLDLVWMRGVAIIGCGLGAGTLYSDGVAGDDQHQCADWPQRYAAGVRRDRPDVAVLLLGGWEVFDRDVDGQRLVVGTPAMEQYLLEKLERARRVLTAGGAQLALLTTPCFSVPKRDLGEWGEKERSDPERVLWLNRLLARYAAQHPDDVHLLDLFHVACPGGKYAAKIDGVKMRTDGVHFTSRGALVIWRWLAPELRRIAADQAR